MRTSLKAAVLAAVTTFGSAVDGHAEEAPAEATKVCADHFRNIPGTENCILLGGYLRFLGGTAWDGDPLTITGDDSRFYFGRLAVNLDARAKTPYGDLRWFLEFRATATEDEITPDLRQAFFEFGGFRGGIAPSYFTIDPDLLYLGTHNTDFSGIVLLGGYTLKLAGGWSASVGVEGGNLPTFDGQNDFVFFDDASDIDPGPVLLSVDVPPVVVANLVHTGARSTATIAGAFGETRSRLLDDDGGATFNEISATGWAVAGGVRFTSPDQNTSAVFKAAYSDGLSYYTLGSGSANPGNFTWVATDGDLVQSLGQVQVFTAFAGLVHKLTPTLTTNIGVGYFNLDLGVPDPSGISAGLPSGTSASGFTATANLVWTPITGLNLGLELIYGHLDADESVAGHFGLGGGGSRDDFGALFRINRAFNLY
jgi:hypothetical protein